jgi:hypothetical protein
VFELLTQIFPCIAAKENPIRMRISFSKEVAAEKQRVFGGQLLDIFCSRFCSTFLQIRLSNINSSMASIQFLEETDHRVLQEIRFNIKEKYDIPIVMKMLVTPRADGKQRAIVLDFPKNQLARETLYAIKKVLLGI